MYTLLSGREKRESTNDWILFDFRLYCIDKI